MVLLGKLKIWKFPIYVIAQFLGAFTGAAAVFGLYYGNYTSHFVLSQSEDHLCCVKLIWWRVMDDILLEYHMFSLVWVYFGQQMNPISFPEPKFHIIYIMCIMWLTFPQMPLWNSPVVFCQWRESMQQVTYLLLIRPDTCQSWAASLTRWALVSALTWWLPFILHHRFHSASKCCKVWGNGTNAWLTNNWLAHLVWEHPHFCLVLGLMPHFLGFYTRSTPHLTKLVKR